MSDLPRAVAFVDRDGTLVHEPDDFQIDSLEKLELVPGVMPALMRLAEAGYRFVMVTNQDGLGTDAYPAETYETCQAKIVSLFRSQGITFDEVFVCPHFEGDGCSCRKPSPGLVSRYLADTTIDRARSIVVGDRESDVQLAEAIGVRGIRLARNGVRSEGPGVDWAEAVQIALGLARRGRVGRKTTETEISCEILLDGTGRVSVATGLPFFDHMLEQLSAHGGFDLTLDARGDLEIDPHHTVEDCGIVIGQALREALGERTGLGRYGFVLPMDDAESRVALDLASRRHFSFAGDFPREMAGDLPTDLVPHFFRSLVDALGATLNVTVSGQDTHHMVESTFKGVGRALRDAARRSRDGGGVTSTKGTM